MLATQQRQAATRNPRATGRKEYGKVVSPIARRGMAVRALPDAAVDINTLSIAALGLGGASFLTTFFVLPKLYTRNTDWKEMLPALRASGLRSISPREANAKSRSAVLLDVRLPERFAEGAPARAVNVPLYLPIANWDLPSILRRIGFAFFGVAGTELNPQFIEQVREVIPKGREVLVICENGGSIESKPGNDLGRQSRSLKAIYYLQQAGLSKVTHVSGGLAEWLREDLPTTLDDDDDGSDGGQVTAAQRSLSLASMFARK